MKKNRPHIVPLSRQALSILRQLKETANEKRFVFPGLNTQTADGTINCNSLLNALADIGYKGVMTGHGYRSLARTILAENDFEKAHVELQLSHANDDKTDAAYNHTRYLHPAQSADAMVGGLPGFRIGKTYNHWIGPRLSTQARIGRRNAHGRRSWIQL